MVRLRKNFKDDAMFSTLQKTLVTDIRSPFFIDCDQHVRPGSTKQK